MNYIDVTIKGAAALLLAAALASGAQAGTKPDGLTFAVKVSKNGGAPFNDCFSFNSDGRLTVKGLRKFGTLVYADDTYGADVTWVSVAPPAFVSRYGAGFMFAGQVDNGDLMATGLSTPDFVYTVTGTPTSSCATAPAAPPNAWTSHR